MQIIGAASSIKSIQRGVVSIGASTTVSISPVNLNKSSLQFSSSLNGDFGVDEGLVRGIITSSVLLTFDRGSPSGVVNVSWEVIEYV